MESHNLKSYLFTQYGALRLFWEVCASTAFLFIVLPWLHHRHLFPNLPGMAKSQSCPAVPSHLGNYVPKPPVDAWDHTDNTTFCRTLQYHGLITVLATDERVTQAALRATKKCNLHPRQDSTTAQKSTISNFGMIYVWLLLGPAGADVVIRGVNQQTEDISLSDFQITTEPFFKKNKKGKKW